MKSTGILCVYIIGLLSGCASVETQQKNFVAYQNSEIGRPFYAHDLQGTRKEKIGEHIYEFMPDPIPETGCGVIWSVDTRTKGAYNHPNGMVFQIEGMKVSWRFVGDPQKCLLGTSWNAW
jgi:uncharacterized protein YceK